MRFLSCFRPWSVGILLVAAGCGRSPLKQAFRELDDAIAHREEYVAGFEMRNDSLRTALRESASDSLRWVLSEQLYRSYQHFSVDSAARYMLLMRDYAARPDQRWRSALTEVQLLGWSRDEQQALALYERIDTAGMKAAGLLDEYLSVGIKLFTNIQRFPRIYPDNQDFLDSLRSYREAYIAIDTVSYEGKKIKAQYLRSEGHLDESLTLFQHCYAESGEDDIHELISIVYNIGMLYGHLGDMEQKQVWLARCAAYDFKAPNRDFLSLYELAMTLYEAGDLTRASRYIKLHFREVNAGKFQPLMIWSSRASDNIVDAFLKAERGRYKLLFVGILVISLLLLVILSLFLFSRGQARRLAVANADLAVANSRLETSNRQLAESNKIKDNYVFRYMDLSLRYLDKVEENRHEYRQIAKNEGTDALMKALRGPSGFGEYKEFYRIFDQTFLGIFPDFVEQVNALLREDARFDVEQGRKVLPTELRILAALKLGIDRSPQIASFLKCSLPTVYTYRAKLRNQALCPKNEFEDRVKSIG